MALFGLGRVERCQSHCPNSSESAQVALRLTALQTRRLTSIARQVMEPLEQRLLMAAGPFLGSPIPVPGTIPLDNYDLGGEGVSYHDTTPGNQGGAYRN